MAIEGAVDQITGPASPPKLKREIGLWVATALVVGNALVPAPTAIKTGLAG